MIMTKIDRNASKASMWLLLAAMVSLATSWGLDTPKLSQKAAKLDQVEQKQIPALKTALAKCEKTVSKLAAAAKADNGPPPEAVDQTAKTGCPPVPPVAGVPPMKPAIPH